MKISFEKHEIEYILELLRRHIGNVAITIETNPKLPKSAITFLKREMNIALKLKKKLAP